MNGHKDQGKKFKKMRMCFIFLKIQDMNTQTACYIVIISSMIILFLLIGVVHFIFIPLPKFQEKEEEEEGHGKANGSKHQTRQGRRRSPKRIQLIALVHRCRKKIHGTQKENGKWFWRFVNLQIDHFCSSLVCCYYLNWFSLSLNDYACLFSYF